MGGQPLNAVASGRRHDHATTLWCLPFGLLIGMILGPMSGLIASIAFVFGGLWLSPDLDTCSIASHRWGHLAWIWWPYRRLIPHRSLWSHGPLLGTATRLLLLLTWTAGVVLLLPGLNVAAWLGSVHRTIQEHPQPSAAILLGLEASTWLHLLLDGDPWPAEWTRRRRR